MQFPWNCSKKITTDETNGAIQACECTNYVKHAFISLHVVSVPQQSKTHAVLSSGSVVTDS